LVAAWAVVVFENHRHEGAMTVDLPADKTRFSPSPYAPDWLRELARLLSGDGVGFLPREEVARRTNELLAADVGERDRFLADEMARYLAKQVGEEALDRVEVYIQQR